MSYSPGVYRKQGGNEFVIKFGTGIVQFGETPSISALLMGGGSNASPLTTSSASKNFLDFRTKSTDTTGSDSRNTYLKHTLSGGGDSGETLRAYTVLEGVDAIAARGAHVSLDFGASAGNASGEASVLKATLHVANKAFPAGGTYAAIVAEAYVAGNTSSLAAVTQHSLFRGTVGGPGDATAKAKVKYFLALDGVSDAAGTMVHTGQSEPTWGAACAYIGILINGQPYYLVAKDGAVV